MVMHSAGSEDFHQIFPPDAAHGGAVIRSTDDDSTYSWQDELGQLMLVELLPPH